MMQALPSFASLRLRTHHASSLNIFIFSVLLGLRELSKQLLVLREGKV